MNTLIKIFFALVIFYPIASAAENCFYKGKYISVYRLSTSDRDFSVVYGDVGTNHYVIESNQPVMSFFQMIDLELYQYPLSYENFLMDKYDKVYVKDRVEGGWMIELGNENEGEFMKIKLPAINGLIEYKSHLDIDY